MSTHRTLGTALGFFLVAGSGGEAQTAASYDPFAVPSGQLLCRIRPIEAGDASPGVRQAYSFIEGDNPLRQRVMDVGYTAEGRPVFLTIVANAPELGGSLVTHGVTAAFGREMFAVGLWMRGDAIADSAGVSTTDSTASMPRGWHHLTEPEAARALSLSIWLWGRRCARNNGRGEP